MLDDDRLYLKRAPFSEDDKRQIFSVQRYQRSEVTSIAAAGNGKSRPGKRAIQIDRYRENCLSKIANLESRMQAIGNKQDPEWKKLRC